MQQTLILTVQTGIDLHTVPSMCLKIALCMRCFQVRNLISEQCVCRKAVHLKTACGHEPSMDSVLAINL